MEFAKRHFWLGSLVGGESKQTQREALDKVAEFKKCKPSELYKIPKVDFRFIYLFNWFLEIKGQDPLQFSEILAWSKLRGFKIKRRELSALLQLDSAFYNIRNGND